MCRLKSENTCCQSSKPKYNSCWKNKRKHQQITQIQIILCSAVQCSHILPKAAKATKLQSILAHFSLPYPSRYGTMSRSALHYKFLLWSENKGMNFDAGAAEYNNPIEFVAWKDNVFFVLWDTTSQGTFYLRVDCVIHRAHLSGLLKGQKIVILLVLGQLVKTCMTSMDVFFPTAETTSQSCTCKK